MNVFSLITLIAFTVAGLCPVAARATVGDKITIQGRIVHPSGTPVTGASTQFRIQILSPDATKCVLYDETRVVDLSNSSGLFSLNIADGSGTRTAPLTYSLERALSNRVDLIVDGEYCLGPGSTAGTNVLYHPHEQDNRKVIIQFRDPGTMGSAWETIPEMHLNPVPYAIDSRSVGGYSPSSFLKVVDGGVPGSPAAMTTGQFNELTNLISGSSANYMSSASSSNSGARLPSYSGNPASPTAGSIWYDSGTNSIKFSTGSGPALTLGASSSGSGMVSSVSANAPLVATGTNNVTLSMSAVTPALPSTALGDGANVPVLTLDSFGRVVAASTAPISGTLPSAGADHQVLMANGGAWGNSYIGLADLRKDAGTPLFPGTCATNRTLNWNSVSGVFECVDLGSVASSQLAAPSGAAAGTYRSVSVNAAGQVLSGTNPTTLGGYFISDAVQNGGSVPRIRSGAADPSGAGVDGELYVATTSQKIFRYDLGTTTWQTMASAGGAGGTVTGITAGSGIAVTGSAATPTVGLSTAGVTAGTFAKVTTDSYGRVTSGSAQVGDGDIADLAFSKLTGKPATLLGHGITEALVTNAGGAASLQAGPTGSRPSPGTSGQIYIDTDTNTVYYRGASAWQTVASAAGAGGTLTDVIQGAGVSVTGTGATRTVALPDVGTASTGIIKINTDAKGRVTGGATTIGNADITSLAFSKLTGTPTTVGDYGITDAVKNPDGTVPTILSGTDAGKPAAVAGNLNYIYIANDTHKIYRQISGTWQVIGAGTTTGFGGSLAGEVSGTQTATQVDQIGTFLRATILSLFTNVQNATDAKTNGAIVKRDASGGFAAGAVTADSVVLKGATSGTATLRAPATVTPYDVQLPASAPAAGQVLSATSGTALTWTTPLSGSTITVAAPITNTAGTIGINSASGSQAGALSPTDWTTFNNKLGTALTAASIWVGNASNVATAVTPSGDMAVTNTGAFTVNGIKGQNISAAGASAGQVLRYAGSNTWTPNFVSMADLRSTVTGTSAVTGNCTASQTLTWNSGSDNLQCQSISIAAATQISDIVPVAKGGTGVATVTGPLVFAGPTTGTAAPSFRALAAEDIAGLPNQWAENGGHVYRVTGSVGIGTSAPSYTLSLGGASAARTIGLEQSTGTSGSSLTMSAGAAAAGAANAGGGALYLASGAANGYGGSNIYFQTATAANPGSATAYPATTKMTLSGNGFLGIGESNPAFNLDVKGSGTLGRFINNSSPQAGREAVVDFGALDSNYTSEAFASIGGGTTVVTDGSETGYLRFSTRKGGAQNEAVRIDKDGNVGIGTTSPATQLHLQSAAAGGTQIQLGNADTGGRIFRLVSGGSTSSGGAGKFTVYDQTAGVSRIIVDGAGNVGIGVTSPTAFLHLKAGTATAGSAPLKFATGTSLTTPENGAVEFDGTDLYLTSGGVRRKLAATSGTNDFTGVNSITGGSGTLAIAAGGTNQNLTLAGSGTGQVLVNSVMNVSNTTASTSSTTGALTVAGGLGVAGAINSGSTVSAATSMITPQIYGSTAASGALRLDGTSHGTVGDVLLNSAGGNVGIGTSNSLSRFNVGESGTSNGILAFSFTDNEQATSLSSLPELFGGSITNNFQSGMRDFALINRNFSSQTGTQGFSFVQQTGVGAFSTLMYLNGDNGNLGIGTTNPGAKLAVNGTIIVDNGAANTGTYQNALLFGASTSGESIASKRNTGGNVNGLDFYTATANRMSITNGGLVGIGTSAPTALLDIASGNDSAGSGGKNIAIGYYSGGGFRHWISTKHHSTTGGTGNALEFYLNDATTANGSAAPGTGSKFLMGMYATGNVGIGTTNPQAKLDIAAGATRDIQIQPSTSTSDNSRIEFRHTDNGNVNALYAKIEAGLSDGGSGRNEGNLAFWTAPSGSGNPAALPRMVVGSSGNVGIGTSAPATKLDVALSSSVGMQAYAGTNGDATLRLYGPAAGTHSRISTSGPFSVYANGIDAPGAVPNLFIHTNGNVGIGTTASANKLEVAGDARILAGSSLKVDKQIVSYTMADPAPAGCTNSGTWPNITLTDCACPAGYEILNGGGVTSAANTYLRESRPMGVNLWRIACLDSSNNRVACTAMTLTCSRIVGN